MGARIGGADYKPVYADPVETIICALNRTDDQAFRHGSVVARFEKIWLVSTKNITLRRPPVIGDPVVISPADNFPELTNQSFKIIQVEALRSADILYADAQR